MLKHLARSTMEAAFNKALQADPQSAQRLRSVRDTCVCIQVKELPEPLTMRFTEEHVLFLGPDYNAHDAKVIMSLFDVPQLADAALATQAIQQGKLKVEGDPLLLQRAAAVVTELNIDWEELLAAYLGDVPAYLISQRLQKAIAKAKQVKVRDRAYELLTDETGLLATPVDMKVLHEQCKRAEQKLQTLEKQLAKLEPAKATTKGG